MIRLTINLADDATKYIPAPSRGVVCGMRAVWQTGMAGIGDTVTLSRGATAVCAATVSNTDGLDTEIGVRDATNKDLIFDPTSTTATETVIKVVAAGGGGAVLLTVEFDDYAYTEQTASEA